MAEWVSIGQLAKGSQISVTSFAAFVTQNFEYQKRDGATSLEERIWVESDEGAILLEAFENPDRSAAIMEARQKLANKAVNDEIQNMPHTSTPSFEGYRITRYAGFITGTSAINTCNGLLFTREGQVEASVNNARLTAIRNLKERAFNLNCNAVVGVDVDFVSVDSHAAFNSSNDNHYIVVCANGTAVEIEPIEE